jgi:hypothetical protein
MVNLKLKKNIYEDYGQELEQDKVSKKDADVLTFPEKVEDGLETSYDLVESNSSSGAINNERLPQDIDQIESTKVQIVSDKNIETIDAKELKNIILENKKIKKIIIEEIKLGNLSRTQFEVDPIIPPTKKTVEQLDELLGPKSIKQTDLNIINLEAEANIYIKGIHSYKPSTQQRSHLEGITEQQSIEKEISHNAVKKSVETPGLKFNLSMNSEVKSSSKEIVEDIATKEPNFTLVNEQYHDIEGIEDSVSAIADEPAVTKTIYEPDEYVKTNTNSGSNRSYKAFQRVYKKRKFEQDQVITDLYYQVEEHNELFKLGTLFYRDMEASLKSFGFSSLAKENEKEKTIIGLSAYFSYHMKTTTTVFTRTFKGSYYSKLGKNFIHDDLFVLNDGTTIKGYICQDLVIIEFNELRKVSIKQSANDYEDFIETYIQDNELIIWDLPSMEELQQESELFFPIIRFIDNVSIIIKPNNTKLTKIVQTKDYFTKYHIDIKGLILAPK